MINRKFKKGLSETVNIYFKREYNSSFNCFDMLKDEFGNEVLSEEQNYQLKKFMMLFFRSFSRFTYFKFDFIRM
jgi:hypothetical protein